MGKEEVSTDAAPSKEQDKAVLYLSGARKGLPRPVLAWPAAKFRAAVRAALVAAATDIDRPRLCAVYIMRKDSTVTIAGCDGHWLFRWREVEGQTDFRGDEVNRRPFSCLIPRRTLESFVDATKKHAELEWVLLNGEDQRWTIETIMDVCRLEFLQVPEEYPRIDDVSPTSVSATTSSIAVGANMLNRVAKAFSLATGDVETTIFWQLSGGPESPLVCTSPTNEELFAVVMPRRAEADANAVPEKPVADSGVAAP